MKKIKLKTFFFIFTIMQISLVYITTNKHYNQNQLSSKDVDEI